MSLFFEPIAFIGGTSDVVIVVILLLVFIEDSSLPM